MIRVAVFCFTSVGFVVLASAVFGPAGHADSVHLRNGNIIHGKARDLRADGGPVRVEFSNGGFLLLPASEVTRIVENDRDEFQLAASPPARAVTAAAPQRVRVVLKSGKDYYGSNTYVGVEGTSDDAAVLVLELPQGGKLRIARAQIESIEPVQEEEAVPAVEPGTRKIPTTHIVHLRNGRKLRGNLLPTGDDEPVKIRVGSLGVLSLQRIDVERVEEAADSYELPAEATEAQVEPPPPTDAELRAKLKEEIRREILRELLQALIDDRIDSRLNEAIEQESLGSVSSSAEIPAEVLLDIQFLVRELGRQRTTNRTRAEAQLIEYGPVVLPYLESAVTYPFDLTRRAVQRIVRDIGDVRGIPYAISGLDDPDVFVRRLAHEALQALVADKVAYDPESSSARRREAQDAYRGIWRSMQEEYLRDVLLESAPRLATNGG